MYKHPSQGIESQRPRPHISTPSLFITPSLIKTVKENTPAGVIPVTGLLVSLPLVNNHGNNIVPSSLHPSQPSEADLITLARQLWKRSCRVGCDFKLSSPSSLCFPSCLGHLSESKFERQNLSNPCLFLRCSFLIRAAHLSPHGCLPPDIQVHNFLLLLPFFILLVSTKSTSISSSDLAPVS